MKNYIPKIAKKDLIHGRYYSGSCRNTSEARWDGLSEVFVYWRTKFGSKFLETIKHPEDDLIFDVFVVEKLIEENQQTELIPI